MKYRLSKRDLGLEVPDFTGKGIGLLESPYDLIADWAQYVPLDPLLELSIAAMILFKDNDDGTVTMKWSALTNPAIAPIVPLSLFRRTSRYLDDEDFSGVRRHLRWRDQRIFVVEGRPVGASMFRDAMARALFNAAGPT